MRIENSIRIFDIVCIMKIAINTKHGGFDLSEKAVLRYAELAGINVYKRQIYSSMIEWITIPLKEYKELLDTTGNLSLSAYTLNISRNDPILIRVIEELGKECNTAWSAIKVVEIPDDVEWEISDYDGAETILEVLPRKPRTWS